MPNLKRALLLVPALLWAVNAPAQEPDDAVPLAKIITVTESDGAIQRQFFGRVAARETVDLAFQVAGQLNQLPIAEGEPLAKGALIAQLDLEPFQIALDQALAQKEQADRSLERLSQLSRVAVSQAEVDDAKTLSDLMAIAVRNAERSLKNATLLAPYDALVASRHVANFSTVGAGAPIVRLHDMSELQIEIDVPEVLFQSAGEYPDVRVEAEFPAIARRFPLEVREFKAETSEVGQTFRIILAMPPPKDREILPGSSATVFATLFGPESRLVIPSSAIVFEPDGTSQVMVYTPSADDPDLGTVKAETVEVTPTDNGNVLVTRGLTAGMEIIASGGSNLRDGDTVRRFSGFPQ